MQTRHVGRPLTADEFRRLTDEPGYRLELVRGLVVRSPGPGARHGEVAANIVALLHPFVRRHRLGRLLSGGAAYVLERAPDTVRGPDISFVTHHHAGKARLTDGYLDGAPTLAIEILSPSNRSPDIGERLADFFRSGCREAWLVDPRRRAVTVHRPDEPPVTLGPDDTLQTPVLPGFACRVAAIFDEG